MYYEKNGYYMGVYGLSDGEIYGKGTEQRLLGVY